MVTSSGMPAVSSLIGSTTPPSRKISIVRAWTPFAFGYRENSSRRSSTRHRIPARPSERAALKPTGPAPMIKTSVSSLIANSPRRPVAPASTHRSSSRLVDERLDDAPALCVDGDFEVIHAFDDYALGVRNRLRNELGWPGHVGGALDDERGGCDSGQALHGCEALARY